jgi:hypothetical protein
MNHQPDVNWDGYLRDIPLELADSIRGYMTHCSRSLKEENCIQQTRSLLSGLCAFSHSVHLTCVQGITPRVWFAHVEARIRAGIKPNSLNTILRIVQSFLRYL